MILVFKTNVETIEQVNSLKKIIEVHFPDREWNFDLEDCDRIFRIESNGTNANRIISIFKEYGFSCEELSDQAF